MIEFSPIEETKDYLNEKAESLREIGLKIRAQVLRGAPGPAIIDYAHQNQISMLAMTTHGRSEVSR